MAPASQSEPSPVIFQNYEKEREQLQDVTLGIVGGHVFHYEKEIGL